MVGFDEKDLQARLVTGTAHIDVTPSDSITLPEGVRRLWANDDCDVRIMDKHGNYATYTLKQGQCIDFNVRKVMATGTTGGVTFVAQA